MIDNFGITLSMFSQLDKCGTGSTTYSTVIISVKLPYAFRETCNDFLYRATSNFCIFLELPLKLCKKVSLFTIVECIRKYPGCEVSIFMNYEWNNEVVHERSSYLLNGFYPVTELLTIEKIIDYLGKTKLNDDYLVRVLEDYLRFLYMNENK